MIKLLRLGGCLLGLVASTGCAAASFSATDAGATDAGATADSGAGSDGAELDGGTLITDGGPNLEEPDGAPWVDAGGDAAACGPVAANGASVKTTCSSLVSVSLGGTVEPGTYILTAMTLYGSTQYCSVNPPAGYSGRLEIVVSGGGFHFDERITRDGFAHPTNNKAYDLTASGATLKVFQRCGVALTDLAWSYTASKLTATTLAYSRDYGTGEVRLTWTKQ